MCVSVGVGGPTWVVWVSSVLGVGVCTCRCWVCVSVDVGGPTCVVWVSSGLGVGVCICRCGWTYLCCLGELFTWCGCVYL